MDFNGLTSLFRPKKKYNVKKKNPFSNYKKERVLGEGGYAKVYLYRKGQRNFIAIKQFSKALTDSKYEFDLEVDGYRGAGTHKNLVKFMDAFENEHSYCVVLEYCAEGPLSGIYEKFNRYTEKEVRDIVYQCCDALNYLLKKKIVHRDIKPDNILVKKWHPIEVCLADLNFSTKVASNFGTRTVIGTILGTKGYMAPEIENKALRNAKKKYNFTVDVFALGIVAYGLLTGDHRNRPSYEPPQEDIAKILSDFSGTNKQKAVLLKKTKTAFLEELAETGVPLLPEDKWKKISDEAKLLIPNMISPAYSKRPTYDEILGGDWAKKTFPKTTMPILERDTRI